MRGNVCSSLILCMPVTTMILFFALLVILAPSLAADAPDEYTITLKSQNVTIADVSIRPVSRFMPLLTILSLPGKCVHLHICSCP